MPCGPACRRDGWRIAPWCMRGREPGHVPDTAALAAHAWPPYEVALAAGVGARLASDADLGNREQHGRVLKRLE